MGGVTNRSCSKLIVVLVSQGQMGIACSFNSLDL